MAVIINQDGKMSKEKKIPKYYEPRIEWVDITPALAKKYLSKELRNPDHIAIGKSISYSAEYIRQILVNKPDKVNKRVWDAIVAYVDNMKPSISAAKESDYIKQRRKSKQ